jgi:hypothetical protein
VAGGVGLPGWLFGDDTDQAFPSVLGGIAGVVVEERTALTREGETVYAVAVNGGGRQRLSVSASVPDGERPIECRSRAGGDELAVVVSCVDEPVEDRGDLASGDVVPGDDGTLDDRELAVDATQDSATILLQRTCVLAVGSDRFRIDL